MYAYSQAQVMETKYLIKKHFYNWNLHKSFLCCSRAQFVEPSQRKCNRETKKAI